MNLMISIENLKEIHNQRNKKIELTNLLLI